MISAHDIILLCLVGLALTLSKQPKRLAVGVCATALFVIVALDYFLSGVDFYWMALCVEAVCGLILWGAANDLRQYDNRMYYRALSSFFVCSCIVTGFYIYDVWIYADHSLYAATSRSVGVLHAVFMVGFSDTVINSGLYSKGVAFIDDLLTGNRHHT